MTACRGEGVVGKQNGASENSKKRETSELYLEKDRQNRRFLRSSCLEKTRTPGLTWDSNQQGRIVPKGKAKGFIRLLSVGGGSCKDASGKKRSTAIVQLVA